MGVVPNGFRDCEMFVQSVVAPFRARAESRAIRPARLLDARWRGSTARRRHEFSTVRKMTQTVSWNAPRFKVFTSDADSRRMNWEAEDLRDSHWAPIAVVALGDPTRRDEGLPLRVIGRVRTLIGEIGCSRSSLGAENEALAANAPAVQGSLALDVPSFGGELVQWIEGGAETDRLDPWLEDRRRVVLLDAVDMGRKPGTVVHWSLSPGRHGLTYLQHYGRPGELGFEHLAFWLEDDLPPSGLDLIAVQPSVTSEGLGFSNAIERRFSTICSQVTALVFRILVEEGW